MEWTPFCAYRPGYRHYTDAASFTSCPFCGAVNPNRQGDISNEISVEENPDHKAQPHKRERCLPPPGAEVIPVSDSPPTSPQGLGLNELYHLASLLFRKKVLLPETDLSLVPSKSQSNDQMLAPPYIVYANQLQLMDKTVI